MLGDPYLVWIYRQLYTVAVGTCTIAWHLFLYCNVSQSTWLLLANAVMRRYWYWIFISMPVCTMYICICHLSCVLWRMILYFFAPCVMTFYVTVQWYNACLAFPIKSASYVLVGTQNRPHAADINKCRVMCDFAIQSLFFKVVSLHKLTVNQNNWRPHHT